MGLFFTKKEEEPRRSRVVLDPITGKEIELNEFDNTSYSDAEVSSIDVSTSGDELIVKLYNENGISDTSRSIYRVEDFLAALPETLPEDIRRSTCVNVLKASGFDPSELEDDGNIRSKVLASGKQKLISNNSQRVDSLTADISDLEKQIQDKRTEILSIQQANESITSTIDEETSKIEKLMKIIRINKEGK